VDAARIHFVGNVMIDTLVRLLPTAEQHLPAGIPLPYALVTLHRPSNVDDLPWLRELFTTLTDLSAHLNVIFPVHPRTRQRFASLGELPLAAGSVCLLEPLPYLEFLALQQRAALVITDSGGIQEETTFLNVPCLTVRDNTERPITVAHGTNQLVGRDLRKLQAAAKEILNTPAKIGGEGRPAIPLWDGHAAERIAHIIAGG
jgi:UDP-N-acetylglucosamine 2-epimerase (non-hydrolysing)